MFELFLIILLIIIIIAIPKARAWKEIGRAVENTADSISLVNDIWADMNKVGKDKWTQYKSNQLK